MAETPQKVNVQARRVDSSILPANFSQPYRLYIIQQNSDFQNLANSSNQSAELAYQATVKNEEQDVVLDDHDNRLLELKADVEDHESRISSNTARIDSAESSINDIQQNKASKTESLLKVGNLAGIADVPTARVNLGLGDAAVKNTGTIAGTVAAGDDARLSTVDGKTGGTISSSVTVNGRVAATGIACRPGVFAPASTSSFNINWTSTGTAELWIDGTRIGTINITP